LTICGNAHNVAVTLVNRSPEDEQAEVMLRDHAFAGPAQIKTVTAARPGAARTLPDVETAHLEAGSETRRTGGRHPAASPVVHRHRGSDDRQVADGVAVWSGRKTSCPDRSRCGNLQQSGPVRPAE